MLFVYLHNVAIVFLIIVFVWSQYDGGNIEQRPIGYGCRQNQEAKLTVGKVIIWPNQQEADPTSSYLLKANQNIRKKTC